MTPVRCDATAESGRDWEPLYNKLRGRDAVPCLKYLSGRGIDENLVGRLIADGSIVLNIMDGSRYCCFAVRDGNGKLQSLFNRQIDGPAERERFLLGYAHPFCLDWQSLANAPAIHICEAIIDALSIVTLHPAACVLAVAGANFDLSKLDLPPDTPLIDSFDNDDAGRAAGDRLRKQCPKSSVRRFAMDGFHDVNDCLLNSDRDHAGACRLTNTSLVWPSRRAKIISVPASQEPSRCRA